MLVARRHSFENKNENDNDQKSEDESHEDPSILVTSDPHDVISETTNTRHNRLR